MKPMAAQSQPQPTSAEIERYLEAASLIVGLPIAPEHKQNVIMHFARTAAFAAQVNAVALPDDLEAAAIFQLPDLNAPADERG